MSITNALEGTQNARTGAMRGGKAEKVALSSDPSSTERWAELVFDGYAQQRSGSSSAAVQRRRCHRPRRQRCHFWRVRLERLTRVPAPLLAAAFGLDPRRGSCRFASSLAACASCPASTWESLRRRSWRLRLRVMRWTKALTCRASEAEPPCNGSSPRSDGRGRPRAVRGTTSWGKWRFAQSSVRVSAAWGRWLEVAVESARGAAEWVDVMRSREVVHLPVERRARGGFRSVRQASRARDNNDVMLVCTDATNVDAAAIDGSLATCMTKRRAKCTRKAHYSVALPEQFKQNEIMKLSMGDGE
eukprot:1945653-Pleurochrysis_carterae.AAC.3